MTTQTTPTTPLPAMRRLELALGLRTVDRPAGIRQLRESIARRALASIHTPTDARILRVVLTGAVLTVATEQPSEYFQYAVDTFRLPTLDETDEDQDFPRGLSEWVLADQYGGHGEDEVDGMMSDALTYAVTIREAVMAS